MTIPYGWFIASVIFSALPIAAVKQYTITNDHKWLIFAVLTQILLILAYINVIKDNGIGVVYPMIKITSIILVALIGVYIFSETITVKHIVGILFGLLAIYILSS